MVLRDQDLGVPGGSVGCVQLGSGLNLRIMNSCSVLGFMLGVEPTKKKKDKSRSGHYFYSFLPG